MSTHDRHRERRANEQSQRRMQTESTQHAAAVQRAMQDEQIAKNPAFLAEFTALDPDSRLYDWLSDELGPSVGKHFALGNREEGHALAAELLARNSAERMIAERTPARLCREDPELYALAQGCTWREESWVRGIGEEAVQVPAKSPIADDQPDPDDFEPPVTDDERRILREVWNLIGYFRSLSEDGKGADIVGKVQTESRTVQDDRTQEEGVAARLNGGLFG